jgi:hypothetical protein
VLINTGKIKYTNAKRGRNRATHASDMNEGSWSEAVDKRFELPESALPL